MTIDRVHNHEHRSFAHDFKAWSSVPSATKEGAKANEVVPYDVPSTIPSGIYPGVPYDVGTVAVNGMFASSAQQDEELIYPITKALWSHTARKLLGNGHAKGRVIPLETALDGIDGLDVRLHPGAERFHREAGLLKQNRPPASEPATSGWNPNEGEDCIQRRGKRRRQLVFPAPNPAGGPCPAGAHGSGASTGEQGARDGHVRQGQPQAAGSVSRAQGRGCASTAWRRCMTTTRRLPTYPGAKRIIEVEARHIYLNNPRYVPNMKHVEASHYIPEEGKEQPVPPWEMKPGINEVLGDSE
jgi:hypothetical protein